MWWGHLELWEFLFKGGKMVTQQMFYMFMWLLLALVPWLVSLPAWTRHRHGMAWWSHRFALSLALIAWTMLGVLDLFMHRNSGIAFPLSGVLIGAALALSYKGPTQDFISLCLCALA